ncbi:hypothetical protein ACLOJK_023257 [Asimina triloba]
MGEIYNMGGRIFGVAGLGPIGCVPLQITAKLRLAFGRSCVQEQNSDAIAYNAKLQKLLPQLQASLPRSQLLYANIFDPFLEIYDHPEKYGIVEISKGCCGLGHVETGPLCNEFVPRCPNSSQFMFWDAVHPSEVVYKHIAQYLVDNCPTLAHLPKGHTTIKFCVVPPSLGTTPSPQIQHLPQGLILYG